MTEQSARSTERWAYTGRRLAPNGKVYHVWQMADGELGWYLKLRGSVVGGFYTVDVEPQGDNTIAYANSLRYTGDREQPELRREWETAERVDMTLVEQARLEKRAGNDSEFDKAMQPLRDLYKAQKSYTAKAAFSALVLAELQRS